jgi:hypothetical protein
VSATLKLDRRRGAILLALVAAGCSEAAPKASSGPAPGGRAPSVGPGPSAKASPGRAETSAVTAAVWDLGSVPYDDFTLPQVSPTARHLATETGVRPYMETVTAAPGAPIPAATAVEIFQLAFDAPMDQRAPRQVARLDAGLILGRSCDEQGVLVERQNQDGSRSIGKAEWSGGTVRWLVEDGAVNAFAALGPAGRLAWSRRPVEGNRFDLVVRNSGGGEWTVQTEESWIFPTWSGKGDGLFLLRLGQQGRLDVVHGVASDATSFRQSLQHLTLLASGATVETAWETHVSQSASVLPREPERQEMAFLHPVQRRAVVWRPYFRQGSSLALLDPASYAALLEGGSFALVTTVKSLVRQNIFDERDRSVVSRGLLIARPTAQEDCPFVLLEPLEGRVNLHALRLLPLE